MYLVRCRLLRLSLSCLKKLNQIRYISFSRVVFCFALSLSLLLQKIKPGVSRPLPPSSSLVSLSCSKKSNQIKLDLSCLLPCFSFYCLSLVSLFFKNPNRIGLISCTVFFSLISFFWVFWVLLLVLTKGSNTQQHYIRKQRLQLQQRQNGGCVNYVYRTKIYSVVVLVVLACWYCVAFAAAVSFWITAAAGFSTRSVSGNDLYIFGATLFREGGFETNCQMSIAT